MFSFYAAFALGLVVTAVVFAVAVPFVVGLFDRYDLF